MNKKQLIIGIIIGLAIVLLFGGLICCTFRPIWIKELPPDCNMTLNTYRMYYDSKDKSGAVPAADYCYKKLHRLACQKEVFGYDENGKPNPVDYADTAKYRNYTQCLSELK